MTGVSGDDLLRLPVRLHGIQLGRPTDLIVDFAGSRVLGLDVLCGDEVHRFLPFAAVIVRDDEIGVTSALTMLEESELAFYRARAGTLSALRGVALERDGKRLGRLRDVLVAAGGALAGFVVDAGTGVASVDGVEGVHVTAVSAA